MAEPPIQAHGNLARSAGSISEGLFEGVRQPPRQPPQPPRQLLRLKSKIYQAAVAFPQKSLCDSRRDSCDIRLQTKVQEVNGKQSLWFTAPRETPPLKYNLRSPQIASHLLA